VTLDNLPFEAGESVEVMVRSKRPAKVSATDQTLRNSVLEFQDPFEPVAGEDWEALR
jgi:hypothetical protein